MVGNINVRKLIGEVSDQIKIRRAKIEELHQRKKLLEEKFAPASFVLNSTTTCILLPIVEFP